MVIQQFSKRLRALREEKGLNQSELAESLGVSRGSVSFYENGDRTPDIDFLYKVSSYFQVSTDYLLGISNAKSPEYHHFVEQSGFDALTVEHLLRISGNGRNEWCYEYNKMSFELLLLSPEFDNLLELLREYLEMTISTEPVSRLDDMLVQFDDQVRKLSKDNLCVLSRKVASELFLNRAKEKVGELFKDVKRFADIGGGWAKVMNPEQKNVEGI